MSALALRGIQRMPSVANPVVRRISCPTGLSTVALDRSYYPGAKSRSACSPRAVSRSAKSGGVDARRWGARPGTVVLRTVEAAPLFLAAPL